MGRTKEQSREYMRAYRARERDKIKVTGVWANDETSEPLNMGPSWRPSGDLFAALAKVGELEEEVRHLKEELAKRPTMNVEEGVVTLPRTPRKGDRITIITPGFSTRPFTPVPKKGK